MVTVAVTGSSGLVGSAVCAALARRGHHVVGVDLTPGRWTSVCGDIRDPTVCRCLVAGAQAVVHTAALHAPHVGIRSEREFVGVNVEATAILLDAAQATEVTRFVLTSSTSVYGTSLMPGRETVWVTERLPPRARDIYDTTKLAAERIALSAPGPMRVLVLRIARCFLEPHNLAVIHGLHRSVLLTDVAAAHVRAVETSPPAGPQLLNIAGDYPFTAADVPQLLDGADELLAARRPDWVARMRAIGIAPPARIDRVYDSAAAHLMLSYQPHSPTAHLLGLR